MCWACDHPGSTYQDQLDHMRGLMVRHGWAVQGALQLVWADDRGHWPWERGFRGRRVGQPVLGSRSWTSQRQRGVPPDGVTSQPDG